MLMVGSVERSGTFRTMFLIPRSGERDVDLFYGWTTGLLDFWKAFGLRGILILVDFDDSVYSDFVLSEPNISLMHATLTTHLVHASYGRTSSNEHTAFWHCGAQVMISEGRSD
jgi:hypothetical protein